MKDATTPRRASPERIPRRVLLIDTLSGANDFGVALALELSRRIPITVLTVANTRLRDGGTMRVLPVMPAYGGHQSRVAKSLAMARYWGVLAAEVWRHRRDCIHVQFFRAPPDLLVYALARPWIAWLVCTAHNVLPHERKWWSATVYRAWYRLVDRIHVLGRNTASELEALGVSRDAIRIIPHGNYERFRAEHPPNLAAVTRRRFGIPQDAVVFLQFGLLRDYKGADRLARAFSELKSEGRAFLVVAGEGPPRLFEALGRQLRADGGPTHALLRQGFLADQDLSDLVEASDIVVFPYVRISQSGALLFGMTYCKPSIASDLAGFRDYLRSGAEGFLVDTARPDEFAAVMRRLAADPQLRQRLGEGARARALGEFSWDSVASRLTDLYARE